MEPVLAALAAFVAEAGDAAIPAAVRDHGALVVADTVGAIVAGAAEPEVTRLRAASDRPAGPVTLLAAGFPRADVWWAITVNGTAGTMLELDEGNRFARGHPGIHVVPAALAEGERLGARGAAVLTAVVLGYDVAARLAAAGPIRSGMHMHGVHGVVGAAAATARLRGLDRAATGRALAVAAGLTLGTSWRTALGGATVRNAYAGVGGATGWLAVDLAQAGFTGLPDMLTETFGRISGSALDAGTALEDLGRRFEVTRNYFKRYACCRFNHPAIEALEALLAEAPLEPEEVESIRVETTALGATMAERDPVGSLGAKFSIPYSLAARLLVGHCGPDAFRPGALEDPRIRALARRVEVVEAPELSAMFPERRPARVEVRLAGGGILRQQVDSPSGEFDRPYPREVLREKFLELTARAFGPRAAAAWSSCEGLDGVKDVRELTDGFRALAR
jgi:2-methylcitrate dehydratase PrpD